MRAGSGGGRWLSPVGAVIAVWGRSTPGRLRLVRNLLLLVGGVSGVIGVAFAQGAATGVERTDTTTARAVIAARELRACLTDADRAAAHAFLAGDVLLGGPGQEYRDAVAGASGALQQLAEVLGRGTDGQRLQAIDAELVTYVGLVEQADATFRAEAVRASSSDAASSPEAGLGQSYLWYASKTLHEPGEGLLARVDGLVAGQERVLRTRPWWLGPGPLWVFAAAAVGWIGGLVGTQVWLARRFRRMLNLPLALATVGAVLACGWATAGIGHLQHGSDSAEVSALRPLLALWQVRSVTADADGQATMLGIEAMQCPPGGACAAVLASLDGTLTAAVRDAPEALRGLPEDLHPRVDQWITGALDASRTLRAAVGAGAADRAVVDRAVVESRRAEPAFRDVDLALADRIQRLGVSWDSQMAATRHVPGLTAGIIVPVALSLLLTAWGFGARLAEYQVGQQ